MRYLLVLITVWVVWIIQVNQPVSRTPDSDAYQYAAMTWRESGEMVYERWSITRVKDPYFWVTPPNTAMTWWTPLYPALLAIGERCGLTVNQTALWLNLLSITWIVWIVDCGLTVWGVPPDTHIVVWCILLFSSVMRWHISAVMSDLPFAALALGFVFALIQRWTIAALIGLAWALTMLRYNGAVFLVTGIIGLGLDRRYRGALAFGLLAGIPLTLYLFRNWILTDTLMGVRFASDLSILDMWRDFGVVASAWLWDIIWIGGLTYGTLAVGHRLARMRLFAIYDPIRLKQRNQPLR